MTVNDILTLTKAGFTKDEIMVLAANGTDAQTVQTQGNGGQTEPKEEPKTEPKEDTPKVEDAKTERPTLLNDSQFKELLQALNVGKASIDVPPNVSIDDKMKDHFTNLLLGKE